MTIRGAVPVLLGVFTFGAAAQAQEAGQQTVADFYKGKQIRIIAPSAAGGGFGAAGRESRIAGSGQFTG